MTPALQGTSSDVPSTAALIEQERLDAERRMNRVRGAVLAVLVGAAIMYAPKLTPALTLVNVSVLTPMLVWTIWQEIFIHRRKERQVWLTTANAVIDITAVTALLWGYGAMGRPELAVQSPIWVAYFVVLGARPFTSSASSAALAAGVAILEYAALVIGFIAFGHLALRDSPLTVAVTGGTTVVDEIAKVTLLAVGGIIATYATAWNERTLRRALAALRASESELHALVGAMPDVIVALDRDGRYVKIASSAANPRHRPPAEWLGKRLSDVLPPEHADRALHCVQQALETRAAVDLEYSVEIDSTTTWFAGSVSPLTDESVVWVSRDITTRKALEAQLAYQALHDPLTSLANRALFQDRVEHAFSAAKRGAGSGIAVLFLDVDEFKTVNDSLGHGSGDRLLATMAHRLLNATRGCDTVARLGGDEFAVLLENAPSDAEAIIVAERIATSLRAPFKLGERDVAVSASIGIARATDGDTAETLLRNADVAMYRAKAEGRGRHAIFEPAMHRALVDKMALETDLREGIERGELRLMYQPIVDLKSGGLTAIEALVRWAHPRRGTLPPALFIPLAESTGLIVPLGRYVLREACRQAVEWKDPAMPGGGPAVTVNLSGRQFQQADLTADVAAALQESGLPPNRLVLEITESVVMRDTEATILQLRALKALGVQLAIDDFGTGYSSLSSIQRFPIDVLKIDKSFIDGITQSGNQAALARTIIALGDMLAVKTVAEGIEDAAQEKVVNQLGCQLGQGYLFAKPLTAPEITRMMAESASKSPTPAESRPPVGARV